MTRVRLEWGPGAIPDRDCGRLPVAVVVDVLSFTTTLSVAMDLGVEVLPHPWDRTGAAELARETGATVAVGRREARESGGVSLSPAGLRRAVDVRRLVLPSPNGAAIAHQLGTARRSTSGRPSTVVGACLRNASAIGEWLALREVDDVLLVPAGERWPDGSMRPAVEDLLGAGAVIDAIVSHRGTGLTPEASAARAAFREARGELSDRLHSSTSGVELVGNGFAEDVDVAAELDTSDLVPVLVEGTFRPG
jgi:2-phosphosulfolactate phosphatase